MKNVANQFRFWVMIGPMVFLATFMVYFLKLSLSFSLIPLIACMSLFLCWRWKLAGLMISAGMLAAALFYYYPLMSAEERFWQVGLSMSFAIGCLVTALCSEETEGLLKALEVESESRLENLRRLDEKLKMQKKSAKSESDDLKNQLSRALNQTAEREGKIVAQEEVIEILREELKALRDTFSYEGDKTALIEMNEKVETLSREKELLQTTLSKLQKELKQEAARAIAAKG